VLHERVVPFSQLSVIAALFIAATWGLVVRLGEMRTAARTAHMALPPPAAKPLDGSSMRPE